MSPGEFRAVDPDLLADYLGGVLDGTPDEAVVARLVAEDPSWRAAYGELSAAVSTVRDDLAGWGAVPVTMPDELAVRISSALTRAGGTLPGPRSTLTHAGRALPGPRSTGPRGRGAATRQRRWSRLATPVAVAAAVAVAVGVGVSQLAGVQSTQNDSAASTEFSESGGHDAGGQPAPTSAEQPQIAAAEPTAPPQVLRAPSAERLIASGTDYTPESLGQLLLQHGRAGSPGPSTAPDAHRAPGQPPTVTGLGRLADPAALTGCLEAVATVHANGPIAVDVIDYATFESTPALVLVLVDGVGERWVWVTGPACGEPTAGPDTRYRSRVG